MRVRVVGMRGMGKGKGKGCRWIIGWRGREEVWILDMRRDTHTHTDNSSRYMDRDSSRYTDRDSSNSKSAQVYPPSSTRIITTEQEEQGARGRGCRSALGRTLV